MYYVKYYNCQQFFFTKVYGHQVKRFTCPYEDAEFYNFVTKSNNYDVVSHGYKEFK